jgi:hypothetical protein
MKMENHGKVGLGRVRSRGARWAAMAFLALGLSAGGARPAQGTTISGVVYNPTNGHYYKWVNTSGTWGTAKAGAAGLGGYLASVTSAAEQSFVTTSVAPSSTAFWIGGTDEQTEGTWLWVNGDAWGYTNWNGGEPNNSGNEDYLMMNTNGTWNDWNASGANPGYVVEWNVNPNIPPIPADPTLLTASLGTAKDVLLAWKDNSSNEASFQVERKTAASFFANLASTVADATAYDDTSAIPSTQYTYRVRAVNAGGVSAYTNEAVITVPGLPTGPFSPTELHQTAATPSSVTVQWTDNSTDENSFELERKSGTGSFQFLGTQVADVVDFTDSGLAPDSLYTYRVRAVNANGSSAFNQADASTSPTLQVTTVRADLKDSPKPGKDTLKFTASYAFLAASPDGAADPVADGITLRAATDANPVVLTLPPLAAGWKVKGSKWTWKNPAGTSTKYKVQVDLDKLTVTVAITGLELAVPAANPMRISIAMGNDAGREVLDWPAQKKAGTFKFR